MNLKTKALIIGLVLAFPLASMAAPGAAGGILGTHHDFASGTAGTDFLTTQGNTAAGVGNLANQVGLCSYCHTPHSAQSTLLLWNHSLSANTFSWDILKTSGGTFYASMAPTYKGPTVKCLSCHDGSVAIGDVSWYKEGPGVFNTFKVGSNPLTPGADLISTATGGMKGNHPVGMAYPFGQSTSTYNGTTTGGQVVLTEFQADPTTATAVAKIKLYTDTGGAITAGPTAGATGLECSTCHDPHNKATTDDLFLRAKIAGSTQADGYICTQCHIK
jgi:hypothetical protein